MTWLVALLALVALLWAVTRFYLDGEDLSRFDSAQAGEPPHTEPSPEHHQAVEAIREMQREASGSLTDRNALADMRAKVDAMGAIEDPSIRFEATDAGGVPAEWVLAPGADPDRRLLYLHGGAYVVGSPRSHRPITATLSRLAGASVLAVDYRLMPEHRRLAGIEDCRTAYRWILEHGPEGAGPVQALFVAGDSAGGNLTLSTIAWARDAGLRAADAVVALSPHTDTCMASPSLRENIDTDHMLGPMFAPLARVPRAIALWTSWWSNRMTPRDPRVSPLRGDLGNLPPTLVHASEAEMLLDDARRWVAKARAAGTDARLRTWHHQLHVWHIFERTLPEAREAFEDIAAFLEEQAPRGAGTQRASA
ncbi:MAG: alpha/beta hydrolase [Pseudomonadales bacterium]|jgi:acetyl esterase/lipase|nr:alpha/beta hydrolase [Pseudomonadales bacterium]